MDQRTSSKKTIDWGCEKQGTWNNFFYHWRVTGETSDKPLVLIHGFGASSSHWRYNAEYFAKKGYRVYSLDLIGFGKSEQPNLKKTKRLDNNFWSKQLNAFLKDVVKSSEKNKVVLVGNSLGGLVALTAMSASPEIVSAVIAAPLPDPAFLKRSTEKGPPLKWLLITREKFLKIFFSILPIEILIPFLIHSKIINFAIQSAYHHSVKSDSDLKKIIIQPAKRKSAAKSLRAMCIGMSARKKEITAPYLLKNVQSIPNHPPILLVWGEKDQFVPLSIGKKIVKQYPWLQLLILKNTGHCPHDESSGQFNKSVLNWLKNN